MINTPFNNNAALIQNTWSLKLKFVKVWRGYNPISDHLIPPLQQVEPNHRIHLCWPSHNTGFEMYMLFKSYYILLLQYAYPLEKLLCTYQCQAWGGLGTHGNLTVMCIPRVGSKPFVTDTFNNYFLPRSGEFDNFFRKCQNPHSMPEPPPPRAWHWWVHYVLR